MIWEDRSDGGKGDDILIDGGKETTTHGSCI